jgi:hypothetical protein
VSTVRFRVAESVVRPSPFTALIRQVRAPSGIGIRGVVEVAAPLMLSLLRLPSTNNWYLTMPLSGSDEAFHEKVGLDVPTVALSAGATRVNAVGGVESGDPTVRMPEPVASWPSGFVIVAFFDPVPALVVSRSRVRCVGSVYVTLFTATPPFTAAEMWLGKPGPPVSGPGSKNPEPAVDVPVIWTLTDDWPGAIVDGMAEAGVAGGGARSWITRTPHESVASAYSWNVQNVMLSVGSMTIWE